MFSIGEVGGLIRTGNAKICNTTSPGSNSRIKLAEDVFAFHSSTFRFKMTFNLGFLFALLLACVNALPPQDLSLQSRRTAFGNECKCYEGESCWPSATAWENLNATVGFLLRKVVPPGAVCYNTFEGKDTYNPSACSLATANWNQQSFQ